jgi:hypothetical protein
MPGGVAILVREGTPARLVTPAGPIAKKLWETGRWCHATVAYGSGRQMLHVMTVYG